MERFILYKFGAIGILAIIVLWSFYVLPDQSENKVEQKAMLSEELSNFDTLSGSSASPSPVSIDSAGMPIPTSTIAASSSPLPTATSQSIQSSIAPSPAPSVNLTPTSTQSPFNSALSSPTPVPEAVPTPTPNSTPMPTPTQSACLIKGNISSSGDKIYHKLGCVSYNRTEINEEDGERWFCTEEEALAAGWRKAQNCPQ